MRHLLCAHDENHVQEHLMATKGEGGRSVKSEHLMTLVDSTTTSLRWLESDVGRKAEARQS